MLLLRRMEVRRWWRSRPLVNDSDLYYLTASRPRRLTNNDLMTTARILKNIPGRSTSPSISLRPSRP